MTPTPLEKLKGQKRRLVALLKRKTVTCKDCEKLGIAGSALPRRIKDLVDIHSYSIEIKKVKHFSKFANRNVIISGYKLIKS